MTSVSPWFARTFEVTVPVDQYPNVVIRLRGTPAHLEELVRDLPDRVRTATTDGKWSAQEHAGHLADLEPLWRARVEDFRSERDLLTVADLSNRKTHQANHNARPLADILGEFRAARLRLVDALSLLEPVHVARSLVHPRLNQRMRLIDHLQFVAEHDDHHLAMIWELTGPGR